jgi:CheY-like chemotaxis protein
VLRERWSAAEQREELLQIQRAGARAVGLTRQLLAFSRQQLINPEVLDLEQAIESAQGMLQRLVGEDIHVALVSAGEGLSAKLDRGQFEQVLMNLAANARDAMPRGGTLTLTVKRIELEAAGELGGTEVPPGDYVELAVADSGIGMSVEAAQRIFEPFFTTKVLGLGKSGGTGLGLAIVRGIVTQSRGYVGVESEPGRGSLFRLLFPRTTELANPPAAAELEAVQNGSARILLVEDDALVRAMAHRVLCARGYAVTVCERGSEALEVARHASFDLLLSDVVMPEISGPELALILSRHAPRMRVLFMSGYAEDEIVDRGVVNPGVALLPKPFTPDTLLRSVQKRLSEPNDAQLKSS